MQLYLSLLIAIGVMAIKPADAATAEVQKVFQQIELHSRSYKTSGQTTKALREQANKLYSQEVALVDQLTNCNDLVALIRLSTNKRKNLPGTEFQHEGQADYLMYAELRAIRKIGKLRNAESSTSLDEVEKLESGNAMIMETIDEVREKLVR